MSLSNISAHGQISQPPGTEDGGVTYYTYHLWHLPSLCILGPDGKPTEPGIPRVSSSIPPYLWAFYSCFFARDNLNVLPSSPALNLLCSIRIVVNMPTIPRAFLEAATHHERSECWCIEDGEELKNIQRRQFQNWVCQNLPKSPDEEMTEEQKCFLRGLYALDVKYE